MDYRDSKNNKRVAQAVSNGIPTALLAWRIRMGFPHQHIDATELVGDKYLHGKFDQQATEPVKKPEKTPSGVDYAPAYSRTSESVKQPVKVSYRRKKLLKK